MLGVTEGAWLGGLEPRQMRKPVTSMVYVDRVTALATAGIARGIVGVVWA